MAITRADSDYLPKGPAIAVLSRLSASSLGVFRGHVATELGVTRDQLTRFIAAGVIERLYPDTYRMTAVAPSVEQRLRAALVWAGDAAAATGRSGAMQYGLEGVRAEVPEIALPYEVRGRARGVIVRHGARAAFMTRRVRGIPVTGPECTLVWLAATLDGEQLEIACEDARRRQLTSVAALYAYLERFGQRGRPGLTALRRLLSELDPKHPSRSTLEVITRRLLVANGLRGFVRELPLDWNGRTYFYDFAFERERTILETNGRRWHDDPNDFERDNEKWSIPGRHGYRIVLATWQKVTRNPQGLLQEIKATMSAPR